MSTNRRLALLTALGLAAGPIAAWAADPMPYGTGNPADWAKERDAVAAAPGNHKVLLENDKVRVLDVKVAPGEVESVHSHQWPSVLHIIEAGDFVDRNAKGEVIFDTRTLKVPLAYPLTMYKQPEAPHSVENLSKTITLHLVRVEMKQ
jgi:mannose-6-phosphate isomerase-like protein (cupin superfamily)